MIILSPHDGFNASVAVELERDLGVIELRYRLSASGLLLPGEQPFAPVDGLWRTTCAEAFIADADGPGYVEYNLSPSGAYAAYRFARYRERAADAPPPPLALVVEREDDDTVIVMATLPCADGPVLLGLTAVVETGDGIGYFALCHGGPKPDFHRRDDWTPFA